MWPVAIVRLCLLTVDAYAGAGREHDRHRAGTGVMVLLMRFGSRPSGSNPRASAG